MRKLIILRGNSASGKTTAARLLQEKIGPNTMLISHDMVRMQILHVWSKEGIEKSQPLMIELLKYGKRNSEVTIVEGILPSKDYGPLFEAAVEEYGDNIYSYYWDIPFEETLIRHNTKPNPNNYGEEEMRRWWREKDYLDIIPQTILGKDLSLEDAVDLIYQDVMTDNAKGI